jgi:hypothetical protein
LDGLAVFADRVLASLLDLGDDREAIARRCPGKVTGRLGQPSTNRTSTSTLRSCAC